MLALGGGEWSSSRPGRFTARKEPRYTLNCRLGGPQRGSGRFWSREKLAGWAPERAWTSLEERNWLGGPQRGSGRFWSREKLAGWAPERVWTFLEERKTGWVGPKEGLDVFGVEKNWLGGPQKGSGRFWRREKLWWTWRN